ncbi:hypothetical protein CASFOL_038854 [Castilleja foliolosa]|uniref:Dynamin stalk domain-containing protein n=1 Tax=Castilleja foliolosa TaxID=1961234 RepID=A0ABD3BJ65_9LAMI
MEVAAFLAHVGSKTSCHRTIGVITKLDIMDRGTDARNFLLGKIIPLQLGYVGVVNRCQEDILMNRSVKDALIVEEKFFRSRPVYSDIADRCGVPQLAKKLNQLEQFVEKFRSYAPLEYTYSKNKQEELKSYTIKMVEQSKVLNILVLKSKQSESCLMHFDKSLIEKDALYIALYTDDDDDDEESHDNKLERTLLHSHKKSAYLNYSGRQLTEGFVFVLLEDGLVNKGLRNEMVYGLWFWVLSFLCI